MIWANIRRLLSIVTVVIRHGIGYSARTVFNRWPRGSHSASSLFSLYCLDLSFLFSSLLLFCCVVVPIRAANRASAPRCRNGAFSSSESARHAAPAASNWEGL